MLFDETGLEAGGSRSSRRVDVVKVKKELMGSQIQSASAGSHPRSPSRRTRKPSDSCAKSTQSVGTCARRCRAEHLPRVARTLKEEKGRRVTWPEVLIQAASGRPLTGTENSDVWRLVSSHAAPREVSATPRRTLLQCLSSWGSPCVAEETAQDLANK